MTAKRVLDLTVALILLLLLSPVLLAVAAALALSALGPLEAPGGVLRREVRAGLGGRPYHLLSFRGGGRPITRLPQLLHVVRGEMSLVGPAPLSPDDEECRGEGRRRLTVRPGLTGLWQVSGRSDLPWEEMTLLDLHYVDHHWLGMDLAILGRTIHAWTRASVKASAHVS
ncbi:sugar transferase [Streptomyces solicathayae]|uniref:Sugar transferase n=1 Tax=Streptomyces solicathayae TaxID=3081768 RepID=A0ABZ0LU93_9ACTN|nr:sugar transferase [Streptomyces sp. HUAS YS2]WOX23080.1 sugar transferase [Streptomyces sp. HUAS YS2]